MTDRETLQFLLARGFDHLSAIAQSIKKISEEKESKDKKRRLSQLTMIFGSINDILHVAYPSMKEIFPEHDLEEFIKGLELSFKDTQNQKLFPPCKCPHCKVSDEQS